MKRLAWGLCTACFVLTGTGLAFIAVNETTPVNTLGSPEFDALFSVIYLAFPVVGALIASREPRTRSAGCSSSRGSGAVSTSPASATGLAR